MNDSRINIVNRIASIPTCEVTIAFTPFLGAWSGGCACGQWREPGNVFKLFATKEKAVAAAQIHLGRMDARRAEAAS